LPIPSIGTQMKKIILIALMISFASHIVQAQDKIITLRNNLMYMPDIKFNIVEVLDGRVEQGEYIGVVRDGLLGRRMEAKLRMGMRESFRKYIAYALPKNDNTVPVVMRITHFGIFEDQTKNPERGRTELMAEYYKLEPDSTLSLLYVTENVIEDQAPDVTSGHELRIRRALSSSFEEFNAAKWKSDPPIKFSVLKNEVRPASITKFTPTNAPPPRWSNLFGYNRTILANGNGWGFTYYGYRDKEKRIRFPVAFLVNRLSLDRSLFAGIENPLGFLTVYMPGMSIMYRLKKNYHVQLTGAVPLGSLELTDISSVTRNDFVTGAYFSQSFLAVSKKSLGLYASVSAVQFMLNSSYLSFDFGARVEIGVRF